MQERVLGHERSEDPDHLVHPCSDQGMQWPLTEWLDTTECMNGQKRPRWYSEKVQNDLNAHIWRHFFAWRSTSNGDSCTVTKEWSGPSLFINIFYCIRWLWKWSWKALIWLHEPRGLSYIYLNYPVSNTGQTIHHDNNCLVVLKFYVPVNPMGHVEHGQFT